MRITKNWETIRNHKPLLQSHKLTKVSTTLLEPLVIEGEKEKAKVKIEVGVVVPTEGVTVITKGVASMRKTRAPPGIAIRVAKGVKATTTKLARVIIIKEARVTTNRLTSLRSTLIRTNSMDTVSNTKTRLETRVGMTAGMAIVEVAIVVLGEDSLAPPVTGVMGFLTTYMGLAIFRVNVTQISYVKRVADPMLQRDVQEINPNP